MKLKLFGKTLFEYANDRGGALIYNSTQSLKQSEFLPDFYTFRSNNNDFGSFIAISDLTSQSSSAPVKKQEPKAEVKELTPKEVYKLEMLNHKSFELKTGKAYVEDQIQQFKEKLSLISAAEYDISRGTNEIASILVRMQNRIKYPEVEAFYKEYPYTTDEKISDLIKAHSYLRLGKVEQFLADMPKEAVDTMKKYTATTKKLCDKKPIFYIIANKKDFEKADKRRDPILLAQSPFGHVWQICGAWDEEMLFLGEL